jgi:DNA-binding NarL/FixJ family response regulator
MPRTELRCVFATLPPLLSAILTRALSKRADVRLLAEFDSRESLLERVAGLDPHVLIIGLQPDEPDALGSSLLERMPNTRIVLVGSGAEYACVYRMEQHRTLLRDFSPDMLLTAIFAPRGTLTIETHGPAI